MRAALVALALAAALLGGTARGAADEYVITIQGAKAGAMKVEPDEAGRVRVDYSFRNNGRGPDMAERYRVDAATLCPTEYEVRGKSTFGGEIGEQFAFADGRVRWTSPADKGDEAALPGSLFVPLDSTPAYYGQLLRALLARPGQSAPAGAGTTLVAERLAGMQADGPAGPVAVALYAITGGDIAPWYLWLRDEPGGAFFAMTFPGWQITPVGYEAAGLKLVERQRQAQLERLQAIKQRTAQALPGLTLIHGVRWFDAKAALMRGPSDVYLFGARITAITAPGAVDAQPQQRIDGRGRTLLPGLVDMHTHMWPEAGLLHLAGGVTTVRDMGNQNDDLQLLKGRIDSGAFAGPHIVAAGLIEGESPFSLRNGIVAADLEGALRAVDWYASRGYRQIKLYNSVKPEWVRPITEKAHRLGLTVAGHVPAFMRAEQAVRAGYDELTHINQVMLNFFVKPDQDTRTLLRFSLVAEQARNVDAAGRPARAFFALLRRHGTTVDPTLAGFEAQFTQRDGEKNPALLAVADHLPVLWRRGLLSSLSSPTAEQAPRWRASFARMLEFVGAMHRAGVPLVAGTDDVAGFIMHRELELYVHAGITPREVLKIATWNGARVAGVGAESGSIERGKAADLLLVEGDPTVDITRLRQASLVIKGSEAYSPAALYEAQGIRPFVPGAAIERSVARP